MSKTNQLREKYVADAEMMASKSRFGYFSLLPSHTAAISDNTAPLRIPHITQLTKIVMGKSRLNLEIYTLELLLQEWSRKATSPILLLHSMALPFKIQENQNENKIYRRLKNGKEKISISQPVSIKHCTVNNIQNKSTL